MGKLRNVFIDFSKMTTFWDFPKWNRGLTIWDGVSSSLPNRKKKKKKIVPPLTEKSSNIN